MGGLALGVGGARAFGSGHGGVGGPCGSKNVCVAFYIPPQSPPFLAFYPHTPLPTLFTFALFRGEHFRVVWVDDGWGGFGCTFTLCSFALWWCYLLAINCKFANNIPFFKLYERRGVWCALRVRLLVNSGCAEGLKQRKHITNERVTPSQPVCKLREKPKCLY